MCAGLVVIAVSANISDPAHVGTSPEIALKNVVFPAPLGPIKPYICPASISRSTRSTAVRPPKRTVNPDARNRSEEHTSELQSLMRISYAVFCLKKKTKNKKQ